jgi:hypothetical protein
MESRLALAASKTYLFQVANVRKNNQGYKPVDLVTDEVAVEVYTLDHQSDILDNMRRGMYGNELLTHSHSRKIWRRYEFDYPSTFDDYQHLHPKNYLESVAIGDTDSPKSHLKLHSTGHDQDNYPFLPEQWIPIRISQLQQLHNIKMTLTIPGDSERTVGEVVEFNLPSPEPPVDNQQVDDKYYRGRYLVQSVRHVITTEKYLTILEIIKDSTFEQYP